MTADAATPRLPSLAGRAARGVSRGSRAVSPTTPDARTPFYDHLMSMINATAVENRHAPHDHELDAAAPDTAEPRWRIGHLITCAAGLVVAVAVAGAIIGSLTGRRVPPVVAADSAPGVGSPGVGSIVAAVKVKAPVERSLPAAEPGGLEPVAVKVVVVKVKAATGAGIETGSVPTAKPHAPPMAKPAAEPATESVGSGADTEKDAAADAPPAAKAAPIEVAAAVEAPPSEQPAADTPLSPPPSIETGSTVKSPGTLRIARIVSAVRLRAGPGNTEAVLAAIPRGTVVEIVECRAWCEVIFSGQRGWVYKGFVGASETPPGR